MNDDDDVLAATRNSLAGIHMRRPTEAILQAGTARRRRRQLTSVGLTLAAIAGVTLFLPSLDPGRDPTAGRGGGAAAAPVEVRQVGFTLRVNTDGSIEFTVTDILDPVAATRALNDAGIAGRVLNQTTGCARPDEADIAVWPPRPRPSATPPAPFVSGDRTVTLKSSYYPAGGGLLVLVEMRQRPWGPWAAVQWYGYADADKIPTCADNRDPGTY